MKKWINLLCGLCFALLAGAAVWTGVQVLRLHMLAPRLLVPLLLVLALVVLLLGMLLLPGRREKRRKLPGRLAACAAAVLLCAGLVGGALAVGKVHETMDAITAAKTTDSVVELYVRTDSGLTAPEEVQTFGWTGAFDAEGTRSALSALEEELGRPLELQEFPTVPKLVDALSDGTVDGIFLSSAYLGILESLEAYHTFGTWATAVHSLTVQTQAREEPEEQTPIPGEAFLVYLSGADTKEEGMTAGLSDVNILAAVHVKTRQVLLLNTPRDFFVPNPASGTGALDKLTHCGAYGVENSMQALSALYDEPIDYYARINFTGFETLIDAIGGVTVYSDYAFTAGDRQFVEGANAVDGKDALTFARERHAFEAQDLQRGQNQMKLITAIIQKVSSGRTLIANYAEILESLQGMLLTNVPRDVMEYLVRMQLEDSSPWHISTYAVNGTSDMQHTYSTGDFRAYVMWPNEAALEIAHGLIETVLTGGTITEDMLVLPEAPPLPEEE